MELLACGGTAAQRAGAVLVADLSAASRPVAAALHAAGADEPVMELSATIPTFPMVHSRVSVAETSLEK